jgi:Subtilase family
MSTLVLPPRVAIRRPHRSLCFAAWAGALLGTACGGARDAGPVGPRASANTRQNVMVIDEGIDVSAPDLAGKVLASFTVVCNDTAMADGDAGDGDAGDPDAGDPDAGASAAPPSFEDLKRRYIEGLMTPDQTCFVNPGIVAKTDPLASVARYQGRWNGMLLQEQTAAQVFTFAEWTELTTALDPEFKSFGYHGTATASTVAHDNPDVRLVLVERQLDNRTTSEQSFQCLVQSELDQTVALLSDPDVLDALAHAPASTYSQGLDEIAARYNVGIVNESFGRYPRSVLEQLQISRGCLPVALGPYFAAIGAANQARRQAAPVTGRLVIQSAGNESIEIDSAADDLDCAIGDPDHMQIGSYDLDQVRSAFSNFGACVDLYAPGEKVIADYAGGWLTVAAGTSFAAPLVARLASMTAPSPYDPAQARAHLVALGRPDDQSVPLRAFPGDFFYSPGAPVGQALLGPSPEGTSPAGRVVSARVDLSPILAPLQRLRAARRQRAQLRAQPGAQPTMTGVP